MSYRKYNNLIKMGCGPSSENDINIPQQSLENNPKDSQNSYRFIRKQLIGKGSYGEVYRCIQSSTKIEYAMKVIKINSKTAQEAKKQIALLKNQIGLLKKISHPNIVKYYSFDVTADLHEVQIVLELVKSGTLKQYIDKNGPIPEGLTAQICKKILEALIYLHQGNLIHRDLKCANILLTQEFDPKLTDFGTAKIIVDKDQDNIAKLSASLKGTPYYMAPQILKRVGHNSSADIWSFGCMVIEMLSGKAPWTGISFNFSQIINYISSGVHPPFPPNISRECTLFLQSCLDPIPNKRLKASQLIKHRFIDRSNAVILQKKSKQKLISQPSKSRASRIDNIQGIQISVENLASPEQTNKSRASKIASLAQIEIGKQSNRNESMSKRGSVYRNKESAKKPLNKDHLKKTEKYTKQIERLEKLQDQISEVSISQEQFPKDYYVVKKALVNLKQKKNRGNAKTSVAIKNAEENLLNLSHSQSVSFTNDLQLRSNTQMTHEQEIINTAFSKAERQQYIEQQRAIQRQRQDQKKKWEQELKQGAQMLKKQYSHRYMFAGR